MRGIRLVVLLLVVATLVVGLLVSAGPTAAAGGPPFVETSGLYSDGCSWEGGAPPPRPYPPDKYWFLQMWGKGGISWTMQGDQLYLMLITEKHLEWHFFDPVVMHSQSSVRLYPVSSYTPDLSQATGWYEGRWEDNGVYHEVGTWSPPWWTGQLVARGTGTFSGQTVVATTVPTEWGNDPVTGQRPGLCQGGALPFVSGTLTMRIMGQP